MNNGTGGPVTSELRDGTRPIHNRMRYGHEKGLIMKKDTQKKVLAVLMVGIMVLVALVALGSVLI